MAEAEVRVIFFNCKVCLIIIYSSFHCHQAYLADVFQSKDRSIYDYCRNHLYRMLQQDEARRDAHSGVAK